MLANQKKKGFTVVELVIVIAVIAILAAVLIPTFTNIINKADTAADMQTVRNLNSIVAAEGAAVGGIKTAHDAIVAAAANGYDLEHITPTADGRTIVWDGDNFCFALISDSKVVFPGDNVRKLNTPKANLFVVSDTYPATDYTGYGVYLTEACTLTEINATTGVDVGYNTEIVKVNYTGTEEVVVRTNAEFCSFTMSTGTVNHYGVALNAIVTGGTYNCYATLADGQYASAGEISTDFAGGLGTAERPYLIATTEQFMNIEKLSAKMETEGVPQYIKLMADVETNTALNTMFCGEFDGDGHTITFNPENWNWPGLFQGTMNGGDTVFKNFTYVCENEVAPIAYSAGFNYTGSGVVFENITVKSATPGEVLPLVYNQVSPFMCNTYQGNVTFRNCVNEISFSTTGNYNGIFIGNYAAANWHQNADGSYAYPTIVFENCVNKGTVSGVNVGFFVGNDTTSAGPAKLVDSADYVNAYANGKSVAYYINNCSNEGTIIGTKTVDAFNAMNNGSQATSASHVAINEALTDAQFHSGMMFVATATDMSLSLNNGNLTINPSANAEIDKYIVKLVMYGQKITEDAPQFVVEYEVDASAVASTSIKYASSVRIFHEYEAEKSTTFEQLVAQYGEKETVQFKYVEVPNADGSVTIVVKPDSGTKGYKYSGAPHYNIYAVANGATVGAVNYRHGEIE